MAEQGKVTEWAVELRPDSFDKMVGQEANKDMLQGWVDNNVFPNAVIFFGRSGSGKSTCSRIVPLLMKGEIYELNAASNNSVDDARKINELAGRLSLTGKHKFFVIDECHMLTQSAWDALLKCVEEPDPKTHFIFNTTNYAKIPPTIRGRSRMLRFYSLTDGQLTEYAQAVLAHKGYALPDDVLAIIVDEAKGQVRDLLKLLQTAAEGRLTTLEKLNQFLARPNDAGMRTFINAVLSGEPKLGLKVLFDIKSDLLEWTLALQEHIKQLVEDKLGVKPMFAEPGQLEKIKRLQEKFSYVQFGKLMTALDKIRENDHAHTHLYALLLSGVGD